MVRAGVLPKLKTTHRKSMSIFRHELDLDATANGAARINITLSVFFNPRLPDLCLFHRHPRSSWRLLWIHFQVYIVSACFIFNWFLLLVLIFACAFAHTRVICAHSCFCYCDLCWCWSLVFLPCGACSLHLSYSYANVACFYSRFFFHNEIPFIVHPSSFSLHLLIQWLWFRVCVVRAIAPVYCMCLLAVERHDGHSSIDKLFIVRYRSLCLERIVSVESVRVLSRWCCPARGWRACRQQSMKVLSFSLMICDPLILFCPVTSLVQLFNCCMCRA